MKIGTFGDLHITNKKPRNRKDGSYVDTLFGKIQYGLEAMGFLDALVLPGDLFDSHRASDYLKARAIELLKELPYPVLAVYGQHDLRFHQSDRTNTPIRVLESSGVLEVLGNVPKILTDPTTQEPVFIYGANWGEPIPDTNGKEGFHILVLHRMIVKDEKLWFGQKDHSFSKAFLKRKPFELIISGDNHQQFTDRFQGRILVNPGSIMRSTIIQKDHRPACYVWETRLDSFPTLRRIAIKCKDFEEVMDLEKAEEEKARNEELDTFIESLEGKMEITGLDFFRNLTAYVEDESNYVEPEVKAIIEEIVNANT